MNIKDANSGDNNPDSERQCLICCLLGSSLVSDNVDYCILIHSCLPACTQQLYVETRQGSSRRGGLKTAQVDRECIRCPSTGK